MIQCIHESFNHQIKETTIEDYLLRSEGVASVVQDFLAGKGPNKLIFYYQKKDITDQAGEIVDSQESAQLFLTTGDAERIKSKGVYFLKMTPIGKPVQVSAGNDPDVLFGEISQKPLMALETVLTDVFMKLVGTMEDNDWGVCEHEQRNEFKIGMDKFSEELKEAKESLTGGIELLKPDKKFQMTIDPEQLLSHQPDQEMLSHYEMLLQKWNSQIETVIEDTPNTRFENSDVGPRSELVHWRERNQRLTSISDQIKSKEIKHVIQVLKRYASGKHAMADIPGRTKEKINALFIKFNNNDLKVTEALNEAKDNVKYLLTLEKFIDPLYNGTPQQIIETLPALMNSVKMIHTIARYYNTSERMTHLFMKITNEMITNCKNTITQGQKQQKLWDREPSELIELFNQCIKLNHAYQNHYRNTKEKLQAMPKGKQFDFSENQIFGKFDLFCRRVTKLMDMFGTIQQFRMLAKHNLEGMEPIIDSFRNLIDEFRNKRHELLDFSNNRFDRDFVEFNVGISTLETELQGFINKSFDKIPNIEHALNLLKKFQTILKRDSLKNDLQNKYTVIFYNYGMEMTEIHSQYQKNKENPPLVRNMPEISGNIQWARHLLHRIIEPMEKFPDDLKKSKESKKFIKHYNRIGLTLTTFEFMHLQAWCNEIEKAKAGLQATLIIRHPDNHRLYVNFDQEIMQLIREAKCLDRMGIEIPESAKIVLLQEEKFKMYHNELQYVLREYERVVGKIRPITKSLLGPHLEDLEFKLRPGMVTLTWTSMNIDGYLHHVHNGLTKLEQLIIGINDIIENRIENNLKTISKVILVEMPADDRTYEQDAFVELQHKSVKSQTDLLVSKNIEVERAVDDLLATICAYQLDPHVEPINPEEIQKLKKYYNWTMYQALLHSTKNSLNSMKERVCGKRGVTVSLSPFFEVDILLEEEPSDTVVVKIAPTIEDVQHHINQAAIAVLKCSKSVMNWFQQDKAENEEKESFYDMIAQDKEIVKVILLLTGSIHGTKKTVDEYLNSFKRFEWLWKDNIDIKLKQFSDQNPELDDFEEKLKIFSNVDDQIEETEEMF